MQTAMTDAAEAIAPPSTTQFPSNSTGVPATDMNNNFAGPLRQQLEYYFSRENLSKDVYLVQQMDQELYVSIALVGGFKMVRQWTTDLKMVKSVLQESQHVTVDPTGTKVRPNLELRKREVDLTSLPPDAAAEEIQSLMEELSVQALEIVPPGPKPMWFILFATEDDAINAVGRLNQLTFRGQPVETHVVTETLLRRIPMPGRPQTHPFMNPMMMQGVPYYQQQPPFMFPYGVSPMGQFVVPGPRAQGFMYAVPPPQQPNPHTGLAMASGAQPMTYDAAQAPAVLMAQQQTMQAFDPQMLYSLSLGQQPQQHAQIMHGYGGGRTRGGGNYYQSHHGPGGQGQRGSGAYKGGRQQQFHGHSGQGQGGQGQSKGTSHNVPGAGQPGAGQQGSSGGGGLGGNYRQTDTHKGRGGSAHGAHGSGNQRSGGHREHHQGGPEGSGSTRVSRQNSGQGNNSPNSRSSSGSAGPATTVTYPGGSGATVPGDGNAGGNTNERGGSGNRGGHRYDYNGSATRGQHHGSDRGGRKGRGGGAVRVVDKHERMASAGAHASKSRPPPQKDTGAPANIASPSASSGGGDGDGSSSTSFGSGTGGSDGSSGSRNTGAPARMLVDIAAMDFPALPGTRVVSPRVAISPKGSQKIAEVVRDAHSVVPGATKQKQPATRPRAQTSVRARATTNSSADPSIVVRAAPAVATGRNDKRADATAVDSTAHLGFSRIKVCRVVSAPTDLSPASKSSPTTGDTMLCPIQEKRISKENTVTNGPNNTEASVPKSGQSSATSVVTQKSTSNAPTNVDDGTTAADETTRKPKKFSYAQAAEEKKIKSVPSSG